MPIELPIVLPIAPGGITRAYCFLAVASIGAVRGPMFLFILGCSRFMSPLGASELSRKLAYFMLCAYLSTRIFIYIFEFREWTENPNRNL